VIHSGRMEEVRKHVKPVGLPRSSSRSKSGCWSMSMPWSGHWSVSRSWSWSGFCSRSKSWFWGIDRSRRSR
jgi:hypothetical protein